MVLLLASASPRRRELLERVGIAVEVVAADIDETPLLGEIAVAHALRLAIAKAAAVGASRRDRWILAADTVVEVDGAILGKARDAAEAAGMLARLVGRGHRVTTAFAVRGPDGSALEQPIARAVTSEVIMRRADAAELEDYVRAGEWRGKAGAYAVQGMAAALVTDVRGSVTNVVGLPLAEVVETLIATGAARPDYHRGVPA